MSLVGSEFVDRINFYSNVWWPARSLVADAIEKRFETWEGGKIISFDNGGCPWKQHFFEESISEVRIKKYNWTYGR